MFLYNRINKKELRKKVAAEPFRRITISFYRYVRISEPEKMRDELYAYWDSLNILGRIYIAHEGINAQLSLPEHYFLDFINHLYNNPLFKDVPIKHAIEDDGKSFFALQMKVKKKIVADGLRDSSFNASNTGKRLDALTFHNMADKPNTIVVDMRNNYESEVGHFKNAYLPPVRTFREALPKALEAVSAGIERSRNATTNTAEAVSTTLNHRALSVAEMPSKESNLLLYCTGGIRCEKASAYFKHHGFTNVYQLDGGIIEYAHEIKKLGLESKFIGKNFVFDERMGERITPDVLSKCYICGNASDRQVNCALDSCHTLIIQCENCETKEKGYCANCQPQKNDE